MIDKLSRKVSTLGATRFEDLRPGVVFRDTCNDRIYIIMTATNVNRIYDPGLVEARYVVDEDCKITHWWGYLSEMELL